MSARSQAASDVSLLPPKSEGLSLPPRIQLKAVTGGGEGGGRREGGVGATAEFAQVMKHTAKIRRCYPAGEFGTHVLWTICIA